MGLVVLNILELKLDDYFRSIDGYFMKVYDQILEDLDTIDDKKFGEVFFKVEKDKIMTNEIIQKVAEKKCQLPI